MKARPFIVTATLLCSLFSMMAHAAGSWPREIKSAQGTLTLAQAPQRIVSTSVTLTGSLLAIDAPVVASGATAPGGRLADKQGFFQQWGDVAAQRGVKRLYIGEANAEAIAEQAPDLIVVSATGNDSAIKLVDQLSAIAPVLVVNYDDKSWQQVVATLGEATGHEAKAAQIVQDFDRREAALKKKIALPPQPVTAMVYNAVGRSTNIWTADSAQGKLLQQLGFTLATPPVSQTSHSMGKRKDIIQSGGENLATDLNGQSYLLFAATDADASALMQNPFLADTAAVKAKRVYALGTDTFRLDYFSASNLLTRLETLFTSS